MRKKSFVLASQLISCSLMRVQLARPIDFDFDFCFCFNLVFGCDLRFEETTIIISTMLWTASLALPCWTIMPLTEIPDNRHDRKFNTCPMWDVTMCVFMIQSLPLVMCRCKNNCVIHIWLVYVIGWLWLHYYSIIFYDSIQKLDFSTNNCRFIKIYV